MFRSGHPLAELGRNGLDRDGEHVRRGDFLWQESCFCYLTPDQAQQGPFLSRWKARLS